MEKIIAIEKILELSKESFEEGDEDFGPLSDDTVKLGIELINYVNDRFNIISSFQTKLYKEADGYSTLTIEYSNLVRFRIKDNIIECILFGTSLKNCGKFKKEKFLIHDTNKVNTFNGIIKNYIGIRYPEIISQYRKDKLSKIKL